LAQLRDNWRALKTKAEKRKQDLQDSLQAHQYLADASEADSWVKISLKIIYVFHIR